MSYKTIVSQSKTNLVRGNLVKAEDGPCSYGNEKEKDYQNCNPEDILVLVLSADADFLHQSMNAKVENLLFHFLPQLVYVLKMKELVFVFGHVESFDFVQALHFVSKDVFVQFHPHQHLQNGGKFLVLFAVSLTGQTVWPNVIIIVQIADNYFCTSLVEKW